MTELNALAPAVRRAEAWLARPVDASSLAVFRILFGVILCGGIVRFVLQGWIEVLYVEPQMFLKYWGFSWVQVWPRWGMYLHYSGLALLALAITCGYRTRLAATLFFLGFTYVELMDVTNYLNHYYLVSLIALLLIFVPTDRAFSIDARARGQRFASVPAWAVYLVRFQIAVVYVNAGLAKLQTDWLLHAQPLGIWLAARDETALIGPWLSEAWVAYAMSWGGFLFDSTIVLWLSLRRTRRFAYAAVLFFHFMTHVFFDIGLFPFLMTAFATIFFAPDWPRRLAGRFAGKALPLSSDDRVGAIRDLQSSPFFKGGPRGIPTAATPHATPLFATPAARIGALALAVFCAAQVLVPLRHFAYPGDVLWNEQGMRWAWKVMVREKNGSVTYHVRDRDTGRAWQVSPTRYLTWRQANEMTGQPDLILQLAHHIARDMKKRGVRNPEVRAEAWVSLNGRRASLMINPTVDLTRVADGIARADWIEPAPAQAPLAAGAERQYAAASSRVQ